jgi:hypothetical protein
MYRFYTRELQRANVKVEVALDAEAAGALDVDSGALLVHKSLVARHHWQSCVVFIVYLNTLQK